MALTTRTLPALMNGISQQPPILRSPDQTEDEVNTWGKIATGLARRPPTTTIQKLAGDLDLSDVTVHHINRDISERYLVIIAEGGIRVFDETTGVEKTVNAPLGWAYLNEPGSAYRAVTVADYTFIVNTKRSVGTSAPGADQVAPPADYRFPGGLAPLNVSGYLGYILAGSQAQYTPNPTGGTYEGIRASMEDLPDPVCNGCVYEIRGGSETSFVSYYVRGDGVVWNETVRPGLAHQLDANTMPHALVREADGTFTFAPFSWQPRRVGDHETNPFPPFVGRTIRDIFFYQNRLGLLTDETVVFSAAGDYGEFFRRTVLDYIDSDTLAASAATTDVAVLDFAVPMSDGVMLFSRQRQFSLTNGESGLSAHSIAIQPVTTYIMSPNVKPSPLGSQVHFASDAKGYVAIQEYTRLSGADPTEAADISAHVPKLIPQGASQLISAPDLDALFVIVGNADEPERSKMYVYQFFWDGDSKIQSAWRRWDFGDGKVISGTYESGALHLLMERPDGYFLEKMSLGPSAVSENQSRTIYLDRAETLTGVYNAGTNTTTFTLKSTLDPAKVRLVRGLGADTPESIILPASYDVDGLTITVPGNESGDAITIGELYETRVVFSLQFAQDWQGRALTTGRLQLHTFTLNTIDTAYLRSEVFPYGREAAVINPGLMHSQEFIGRRLGTIGATLGQHAYVGGPFTFSVAAQSSQVSIEAVNDSPYGSTITSGEWEGLFFSRAM
jgi:hypothetical protein